MHVPTRNRWIRAMLLVAAVYAVVGVVTATLAGAAPSPQLRTVWRFAAWLLSLVAFVGHVAFEQLRLRSTIRNAAVHAAAAVALGAFALAAVGPVRSHWGTTGIWRTSVLSLVLWPILTGVPAFLAALVLGAILRRPLMRDHSARPNNRA